MEQNFGYSFMNIQTFNQKIKQIEFNIETSLIDLI